MAALYFCHECQDYIQSDATDNTSACPRCGSGFIQRVDGVEDSATETTARPASDDDMPALLPPENSTQTLVSPLQIMISRLVRIMNHPAATATPTVPPSSTQRGDSDIGFSIQLVPLPSTPSVDRSPPTENVNLFFHALDHNAAEDGTLSQTNTTLLQDGALFQPVQFVFRINRDLSTGPLSNVNINPNILRSALENPAATQQAINQSVQQLIALFGNLISEANGLPPVTASEPAQIPTARATQQMIEDGKACSICLDVFLLNEVYKELSCHHQYHGPCIDRWLSIHGNCPICRTSLNDRSLRDITEPD